MKKNLMVVIFSGILLAEQSNISSEIAIQEEQEIQNTQKEFTPKVFYATTTEKLICKKENTLPYWFIGASEFGASFIQNNRNKGFDLFFYLGARYNITKKKASLLSSGHSIAFKLGVEYFSFVKNPRYDDIMLPLAFDYTYQTEYSFSISVGLTSYFSMLRNGENSNLSATLSVGYNGVFVRGEYAVVPYTTTGITENMFKISAGYKF